MCTVLLCLSILSALSINVVNEQLYMLELLRFAVPFETVVVD